jgi:hypothetical protein
MNRRLLLERGARALALGAVMALLLLTWRQGTGAGEPTLGGWRVLPADSTAAWATLRTIATEPSRDTLRWRFEALPAPGVRTGLNAVARRAGTVLWEDRTRARGLAASLNPAMHAAGAWRLQVAAPAGAPLVVADAGSTLDSLTVPPTGVMGWQLAALAGVATVRLPTATLPLLSPRDPAPPAPRVIRLIASAGWEAKFLTASLEEAGWRVDGTLAIAPRAAVRIGAPVPAPLTSRTVAAVVVLDSANADVAAISRYVRGGGGLLLSGEAAALSRWRPLVPVQVGTLVAGLAGALTSDRPRLGLAAYALRPAVDAALLVADTLGARTVRPLVVARRLGAGRVGVSALHETWRWRMEGREDGAAAHRRWWLNLVESVAGSAGLVGAPAFPVDPRWPGAQAPYADLVARLGPPVAPVALPSGSAAAPVRTAAPAARIDWRLPLFLLAMAGLLVEWSSRRLRGAR